METIKLPEPVIVEPVLTEKPKAITDRGAVAEPKTTAEQDRHSGGQRRVNLIWEATQAVIAIMITAAVIFSTIYGLSSELLASAFGMIVGMYFQRTNHTKVGGVGGTDTR